MLQKLCSIKTVDQSSKAVYVEVKIDPIIPH